jgi:hypothetical protein
MDQHETDFDLNSLILLQEEIALWRSQQLMCKYSLSVGITANIECQVETLRRLLTTPLSYGRGAKMFCVCSNSVVCPCKF